MSLSSCPMFTRSISEFLYFPLFVYFYINITLIWLQRLYFLVLWSLLRQGEGNGTPLQYSCLENPMNSGAWWAAVRGVPKSRTRLRDFTFTFHFHALEKEMATHSSVLAWRIPGMAEPGGLPSVGSHRVRHDWSDLAAAAAFLSSLSSISQFAYSWVRPNYF